MAGDPPAPHVPSTPETPPVVPIPLSDGEVLYLTQKYVLLERRLINPALLACVIIAAVTGWSVWELAKGAAGKVVEGTAAKEALTDILQRKDQATKAASDAKKLLEDAALHAVDRLPKGAIVMWSGQEIPSGWVLCDGQNGTPDLRNRFVVGGGKGSDYSIGNIGGADSVKLTLQQMPKHSHSYLDTVWRENRSSVNANDVPQGYDKASVPRGIGSHSTDGDNDEEIYKKRMTSEEGAGAAQENRPPYYALAFVMRL